MPEILTRLLGPIPERTLPATGEPFAHPGGPAPVWGGYAPIHIDAPADMLRPDIAALAAQLSGATVWRSHTTGTVLFRVAPGHSAAEWYVACPERDTFRAVAIAADAVYHGFVAGLTPAELAEVERVLSGGSPPWAYRPDDADLPDFVRARFAALGITDEPICGGPAEDGPDYVERPPRS